MAAENDLVLIYFEDKPLCYARIEEILPDSKPNWFHVKLLLLQIPPQIVTWILRDAYINGDQFTMNGNRMRLELVEPPQPQESSEVTQTESPAATGSQKAKVISLTDLKKK